MPNDLALRPDNGRQVELGIKWRNSYPILMRKARHLAAGGGGDPEDLISQATVKVLNYLALDREAENFVGLMLVSLLQVHMDGNRSLGNRMFTYAEDYQDGCVADAIDASGSSIERGAIVRETLGDIFDDLATMPRISQELFQLRFLHDLSYAEISERLGISEVCARQKVKQLRRRLQIWLDN